MVTTASPRARRRTAIRAGRLFDGISSITWAEPLVVVEDGRITSVDRGGGGAVPPDAELLELPGATLLPGLVDTHVHLAFDAGPDPLVALAGCDDDAALTAMEQAATAQLAAGVTTVRDLGDRGYLALRLRGSAGAARPTIVASGPPITSPGGHCHSLGGTATGVDGVRAAVRERAERGIDVVKVMASGGHLTAGTVMHGTQFDDAEMRALVDRVMDERRAAIAEILQRMPASRRQALVPVLRAFAAAAGEVPDDVVWSLGWTTSD